MRPFELLVQFLRWLGRRVHGLYRALGIFLVGALGLALLALFAFSELAKQVMRGATTDFDDRILEWIHRRASPAWDGVALQITAVGNGGSVAVISLVVCAFLWAFRRRGAALLVVMAVGGSDLAQSTLKAYFRRPRPELFVIQTPYARPLSTSFPSGHALGAVALYLILAYLLIRHAAGRGFQWLVSLFAAALVLGIGWSRMYLGVHYPSDVAAGYLIGFIWVTVCIVAFEAVVQLRTRSRSKAIEPGPEPADVAGPADPEAR